jgi:hypothetical protein
MGFIEILQLVTNSKDYALTVLHISQTTKNTPGLLGQLQSSLAVAWWRLLTEDVSLQLGYRSVPGLM